MNKKQEIQNKIDHTKRLLSSCNSNIEDYKADAESYECEIEQLKKQLKKYDKLKLEPFDHYVDVGIQRIFNLPANSKTMYIHGVCYPTEELAKIAMNNSTTRNKLEAYSRVIDPDWRECWEGMHINYYIWFHVEGGEYRIGDAIHTKQLATVYMSEKAAYHIVQALNNKEITI